MIRRLHGIIRGRTIELTDDPGIKDGRHVDVEVREAAPAGQAGDGLSRSAGALRESWTEQDDRILSQLERDRARSLDRELPQ